MSYQTEFPDFKPADMPALPAGFEDSSWHNDACPSYANEVLRLRIFIDYVNPADRELAVGKRFCVYRIDDDDQPNDDALLTDSWDEVLAFIALEQAIANAGYHVLTDDSDKRATAYHVMLGDRRIHIAYSKLAASDFIAAHAKENLK